MKLTAIIFLVIISLTVVFFNGAKRESSALGVATPPQTKLYIVSMMHAEDSVNFHEELDAFTNISAGLRRVSLLMNKHGAKIDFGPDWTFLDAVYVNKSTVLDEIRSKGHGIHTHAHESTYDLVEVNDRLKLVGIENTIANGGFDKTITVDGEELNWVGYVTENFWIVGT